MCALVCFDRLGMFTKIFVALFQIIPMMCCDNTVFYLICAEKKYCL